MKITAKDDRHARPPYHVFFNGEPLRGVVMADDEIGMVVRVKRSAAGHIERNGPRVATEILRGEVRIEQQW